MDIKSEITAKFSDLYKENIRKITGISSPYINSFREEAIEKYNKLGIPTKKMKLISIQILMFSLTTITVIISSLFLKIL